MIFPLLYCYSSFNIATPSVFGNAHWVLKTAPQTSSSTVSTIPLCFPYLEMCTVPWKHCPTSSPTVGTIPYFFPVQFPPFYCYFSFTKVPISIFGSAHWTLETVPNVVTNSEHHHQAHQCALQPCPIYESDHNRCTKMTSFLLELGPLTPLQTRKIYPYHLSFTKYILRPCQHKNIFSRCDSDISGSTHQKYILTAFHSQNIFCSCDTDIIIFVWHFRVHVSKIYFWFGGFLWVKYI